MHSGYTILTLLQLQLQECLLCSRAGCVPMRGILPEECQHTCTYDVYNVYACMYPHIQLEQQDLNAIPRIEIAYGNCILSRLSEYMQYIPISQALGLHGACKLHICHDIHILHNTGSTLIEQARIELFVGTRLLANDQQIWNYCIWRGLCGLCALVYVYMYKRIFRI